MIDITAIEQLSLNEPKSLLERFAKLSEECGELAQEILILHNASGFQHKTAGKDGILGESVDVLLVAFSIFFKHGGSISELQTLLNEKAAKWQKHQKK